MYREQNLTVLLQIDSNALLSPRSFIAQCFGNILIRTIKRYIIFKNVLKQKCFQLIRSSFLCHYRATTQVGLFWYELSCTDFPVYPCENCLTFMVEIHKNTFKFESVYPPGNKMFHLSKFMGKFGRIFAQHNPFQAFLQHIVPTRLRSALQQIHQDRTALCFGE